MNKYKAKRGYDMSCNRGLLSNRGFVRGGHGTIRASNCGISESASHLAKRDICAPNVIIDKVIEEYPITCESPKKISIDRVTRLAGIDDALILTGDIESGLRMNTFYNMVISDDLIGLQAFNFPVYALIKAGDLHTLAVSVGDIENHPISAFLRANRHVFKGRIAELFELAPQDFEVEANNGGERCNPHRRHPFIEVIKPTSLNDRYITIEVSWYEDCNQFCYREIFYLVPLICQNSNTLKGGNLAVWDDNFRTCGETIRIPVKTTDNGAIKVADKPMHRCDNRHGFLHGHEFDCGHFHGRSVKFGGFGGYGNYGY